MDSCSLGQGRFDAGAYRDCACIKTGHWVLSTAPEEKYSHILDPFNATSEPGSVEQSSRIRRGTIITT